MIYLIIKIGLYLLLALLSGAGAGWLVRNLSAAQKEEELQRLVSEGKSELAQFESLLRSRDDQLNALRAEVKAKDARSGELRNELNGQSNLLKSKDQELKQAKARQESAEEAVTAAAADSNAEDRVAELSAELARLHSQLSDARVRAAAAELSRGDEGLAEEQLRGELQGLESRLTQQRQQQDRTSKLLEQEQRKVVELQRERELQSKSLQLLHQQLDLERDRAAGAN